MFRRAGRRWPRGARRRAWARARCRYLTMGFARGRGQARAAQPELRYSFRTEGPKTAYRFAPPDGAPRCARPPAGRWHGPPLQSMLAEPCGGAAIALRRPRRRCARRRPRETRADSSAFGDQHRLADAHHADGDAGTLAGGRIAQIDAGVDGARRQPELALGEIAAGGPRRARAASARRRAPGPWRRTRRRSAGAVRGSCGARRANASSTAGDALGFAQIAEDAEQEAVRRRRRATRGSAAPPPRRAAAEARTGAESRRRARRGRAPSPPRRRPDCGPPRRARVRRRALQHGIAEVALVGAGAGARRATSSRPSARFHSP